jgi:hypothetical protein
LTIPQNYSIAFPDTQTPYILVTSRWALLCGSFRQRKSAGGRLAGKLKIGVMWCTQFKRRTLNPLRSLNLPEAYRAASLFASQMRTGGHEVEFLFCDELLRLSDFDGSQRTLADTVDLLYIVSHGELNQSTASFEALLKYKNWQPGGNNGIGHSRLIAAVFDTCHLIHTKRKRDSQAVWGSAQLGPNVRLLLGFDGVAPMSYDLAERGYAFAENLIAKQQTFATAWLRAVDSTNPPDSTKPVAIGIGGSRQDAKSVVDTASLAQLPGTWSGGTPHFWERFLP